MYILKLEVACPPVISSIKHHGIVTLSEELNWKCGRSLGRSVLYTGPVLLSLDHVLLCHRHCFKYPCLSTVACKTGQGSLHIPRLYNYASLGNYVGFFKSSHFLSRILETLLTLATTSPKTLCDVHQILLLQNLELPST